MSSIITNSEYDSEKSTHSGVERLVASVTVIVPIRNEERHIANTLDQLLDQERQSIHVEILVVDGRSTDNTRTIVQQYAERHPEIRLLDNPQRLSSAARNIAIEQSMGEYLVVIDGHCEIPSTTYLLDLVDAFDRTGADCLGRPQPLEVIDATIFQKAVAAARNSPFGHHPNSYIYSNQEIKIPAISVAVAYRANVFEKVGLFDASFDACEDCELNHRIDQARLTCYLVPKLAVHYQPRKSICGLFKQLARYGRGRVRLARKHANSLSVTSILPAAFLIGLTIGPLVSLFFPFLWHVYFGAIATYVVLVCMFSFRTSTNSIMEKVWLPVIFLIIHLASGWGAVKEFLVFPYASDAT